MTPASSAPFGAVSGRPARQHGTGVVGPNHALGSDSDGAACNRPGAAAVRYVAREAAAHESASRSTLSMNKCRLEASSRRACVSL